MTKICKDKTGRDKRLHVFCEFVIAAVSGVSVSLLHVSAMVCAVIAFAVAIAAGIWKEVKDRRQEGNHFCMWDLTWDFVGSVAGASLSFLASYCT